MAVDQSYVQFVVDQLAEFDTVETRNMFGGVGIYKDGIMFGLIGNDKFYLKAGESNVGDYEAVGMKAFMSDRKGKGMPYYEVPADVLEDAGVLKIWAAKSFAVAQHAKTRK
ncbi:MAG: TfoX/Sxy family protein [Saprospiraceae bacterium]|nr:TfoX/Sxy family protein [Saprospiraceae bacterium]